jgi:hypothetical protein
VPGRIDLTLHERNDETIAVTVVPVTPGDDLSAVTGLEFVLKPSTCDDDDDPAALLLTSEADGGITIQSHTPTQITAQVQIPATALTETYPRAWRLDGLNGAARRTALYGTVTVVNL